MATKKQASSRNNGKKSKFWKYAKWVMMALGTLLVIGLIIIFAKPFFRLLAKVFGFFEALAMTAQSFFVGATGKCIPKTPNLKCGDKNQYSGVECCTGVDKDGNKFAAGVANCAGKKPQDEPNANMTCDHDDTMCCGCVSKGTNPCPNGKPLWQTPAALGIIFSVIGVFLLGAIASVGKAFTGRSAKQGAATVSDAERLTRTELSTETRVSALEAQDKANRETLSSEQQESFESFEEALRDAAVAADNAEAAKDRARSEPSEENERAAREAEEERAKEEAEARERAHEFVHE